MITTGNAHRGIQKYYDYRKKFSFMLNFLVKNGDQPIYSSKDEFLSTLFFEEKYSFLNFAPTRFYQNEFVFNQKNNSIDFLTCNCNHVDYEKIDFIRIKKGGVIKFFKKALPSIDCFDDENGNPLFSFAYNVSYNSTIKKGNILLFDDLRRIVTQIEVVEHEKMGYYKKVFSKPVECDNLYMD